MKFNQTFSVLFWLARGKADKLGRAPIYARVTIDGDRNELSTRRSIAPELYGEELSEKGIFYAIMNYTFENTKYTRLKGRN